MNIFDNASRCIISGMVLYIESEDKWVNGDLYEIGDCWVVKTWKPGPKTAWVYMSRGGGVGGKCSPREVTVLLGDIIFDAYGVVAFHKSVCEINRATAEYLKGLPK